MKVDIFNTDKKYQIIYADPPWTYRVWSGKGKTAANHYSCMKKEEIFELPVSEIADDNCILFLWVTFPCLKEGLQTIEKWGFCYKTCGFTWIKKEQKIGRPVLGAWVLDKSECGNLSNCNKRKS